MPQPFLHFRDVGLVVERIGRSGRTQTVHSKALHADPGLRRLREHALVHAIGRNGVAGFPDLLKQRGVRCDRVAGRFHVRVEAFRACRTERDVTGLAFMQIFP